MTPKMIEQYAALHDMTIPEAIKYIEHEMIYREKRKSPTGEGLKEILHTTHFKRLERESQCINYTNYPTP